MGKRAVHIGAGQIGRGFIGQVLFQAGYRVAFVDTAAPLVDAINRFGGYTVVVLGADEEAVEVTGIRAYTPNDEAAVEELARADVLTTAVGPARLPDTAPYIARGIAARCAGGVTRPLTVIACENMEFGSSRLAAAVFPLLDKDQLAYCGQYVGFADAEVSRMVIPAEDDNPLAVRVEQYMEWVVDEAAVRGDLSGIPGLRLSGNPTAYIKRKMFTLTGHAMLGYMGYQKGYPYIYQAAYNDAIFGAVFSALVACGKGWSAEYGLPVEDFYHYITVMLRRFSDTRLKDPCVRICREPLRKLSAGERLIGPAAIALKHGADAGDIITGIRAALAYNCADDPQAVQLQQLLRRKGMGATLRQVCGLTPGDPLYALIMAERDYGSFSNGCAAGIG